VIGAAASLIGGAMANDAAKDEANEGRQFTKEQLQNRHQWEVEDLRRAGLNPLLSAHSAPSIGSSPTASGFKNIGADAAASASSASDISVKKATQQNLVEQNKNLQSQNQLIQDQAVKVRLDSAATAQDVRILKAKADFESTLSPTERKMSWWADQLGKVSGSAQDVSNIVRKKPPVQIFNPTKKVFQ
jgi:hypothetical protein